MNTIYREPNSQEQLQEKYVEQLRMFALNYIHEHYENQERPNMLLEYHNCPHTNDVVDRTTRVLEIVAPQYVLEGRVFASGHDVYQEWENVTVLVGDFPVTKKQRAIGLNERVSADMLVAYMREVNNKQGIVFPEAVIARTHAAIAVTVPEFDVQRGTVLQPNLTRDSHPVAIALALGDLGGAAMNGGAYFLEEGNKNFREMNSDISEYVRLYGFELSKRCGSGAEKAALRERFLADAAGQVRFAQGRLALLPYELSLLPGEHMTSVAQLMGRLPEAIRAAQQVLDLRSVMTLDELVYDVYRTSSYVGGGGQRVEKVFRIYC